MNAFAATLRRVAADLGQAGVGHAVVGGLAVSARTEPRFTRDVDLAVAVADDAAAEAVIRGLLDRGYRTLSLVEHEATGRMATARLTAPGEEGAVVDLLLASSGIEGEIVAGAEPIEVLPDLVARVAEGSDGRALLSAASARMVESADTMDSKSIARKGVRVQVPLRAPSERCRRTSCTHYVYKRASLLP